MLHHKCCKRCVKGGDIFCQDSPLLHLPWIYGYGIFLRFPILEQEAGSSKRAEKKLNFGMFQNIKEWNARKVRESIRLESPNEVVISLMITYSCKSNKLPLSCPPPELSTNNNQFNLLSLTGSKNRMQRSAKNAFFLSEKGNDAWHDAAFLTDSYQSHFQTLYNKPV